MPEALKTLGRVGGRAQPAIAPAAAAQSTTTATNSLPTGVVSGATDAQQHDGYGNVGSFAPAGGLHWIEQSM